MSLPFLPQFVLVSCFLIHLQFFTNYWTLIFSLEYLPIALNILRGLVYLCYPLCGWIADVSVCHFGLIKSSFVMMIIVSAVQFFAGVLTIFNLFNYSHNVSDFTHLLMLTELVIFIIGMGMYEANAIQFGLDQMLDASSQQLSSFIYWYLWCSQFGPLVVFYIIIALFYILNTSLSYPSDCVPIQKYQCIL